MKPFVRPALAVALVLGASVPVFAGGITLQGKFVEYGLSDTGALFDPVNKVGLVFDPSGNKRFSTHDDIVKFGIPFAFYSIGVDNKITSVFYDSDLGQAKTINTGDGAQDTATSGVTFAGMQLSQRTHLDPNRTSLEVDVELVNANSFAVHDVVYAVGLNPFLGDSNNDPTTINTTSANSVTATGSQTLNFITLRDSKVGQGVQPAVPSYRKNDSNPYDLLTQVSGSNVGDYQISLAYDVGLMEPGERRLISYDYVLGPVPEPGTLAMLGSGLALVAGLALRKRPAAAAHRSGGQS